MKTLACFGFCETKHSSRNIDIFWFVPTRDIKLWVVIFKEWSARPVSRYAERDLSCIVIVPNRVYRGHRYSLINQDACTLHIVRASAQGLQIHYAERDLSVNLHRPLQRIEQNNHMARLQFQLRIALTTYERSSAENKIKPRADNPCQFRSRQRDNDHNMITLTNH